MRWPRRATCGPQAPPPPPKSGLSFDLPTVWVSTGPYLARRDERGGSRRAHYSGYLPGRQSVDLDEANMHLTAAT